MMARDSITMTSFKPLGLDMFKTIISNFISQYILFLAIRSKTNFSYSQLKES